MDLTDSVNKTISRFFWAVTKEPFNYKGKEYKPKSLRVSPGIFSRRMVCVAHCGACCRRFTLDWLPSEYGGLPEDLKSQAKLRKINFDGREVPIYSDLQQDHSDYYCRNLRSEDGRCGIHQSHPFSCDFELLRFKQSEDPKVTTQFSHSPFGRGWNMLRIDGERGALCEWDERPCDEEWKGEVVRRLLRLKDWTDHFVLETTLPEIIKWVERGPHSKPLFVGPCMTKEGGFDLG